MIKGVNMAALAMQQAVEHSTCPALKVIFEDGNELNTVNKMVIERDVRKACAQFYTVQECITHLYLHYSKVCLFVAHVSLEPCYVAVHLKDANGLPGKMRQFLIIENKGE